LRGAFFALCGSLAYRGVVRLEAFQRLEPRIAELRILLELPLNHRPEGFQHIGQVGLEL
jgi:hypothetical protein